MSGMVRGYRDDCIDLTVGVPQISCRLDAACKSAAQGHITGRNHAPITRLEVNPCAATRASEPCTACLLERDCPPT
jgi:hypothetical protein